MWPDGARASRNHSCKRRNGRCCCRNCGRHRRQVLALFNKAIRKLHGHLRAAKEAALDRQLPRPSARAAPALAPADAAEAAAAGPLLGQRVTVGLHEELEEAAAVEREKMKQQFRPEDLQQYAITGGRARGGGAACSDAVAAAFASTKRLPCDGGCRPGRLLLMQARLRPTLST